MEPKRSGKPPAVTEIPKQHRPMNHATLPTVLLLSALCCSARPVTHPSPLFPGNEPCAGAIREGGSQWTVEVENGAGAGEGVAMDASGNSYVTGHFSGSGSDFDPLGTAASVASSIGGKDGLIAKYDAAGRLVWKRQFGGTAGDDIGRSIALDDSGNIYVVGSFEGGAVFGAILWMPLGLVSAGGSDAFVAKYDAGGNLLWARGLGGSGDDVAHDVAVDGDGNVHVTGYFSGTADFDPGSSAFNIASLGSTDAFICRLTASGGFSWATRIGGFDTDVGLGITMSGDRVVACGYQRSDPAWAGAFTLNNGGGSEVFVAAVNAHSGAVENADSYGGDDDDIGYDIVGDRHGNLYVAGSYQGYAQFWNEGLESGLGSDATIPEAFILKLDTELHSVWAKSTQQRGDMSESTGCAQAFGLSLDPMGCNVYVTGRFVGHVDFEPGSSDDWLTDGVNGLCPNHKAFLWSFDQDGNYLWAESFGDTGVNSGNAVAVRRVGLDLTPRLSCTGYFDEDNLCTSTMNGDLFLYRK